MTAVRELVLVLGLLVSARCEVRARDPEVDEDDEESGPKGGGGGGGGGAGGAASPPILEGLHPRASETSPLGDRGSHPARTGNWCAFVQKRVVTVAVKCGTETYTIKSQSPCPSGKSDCQLVMYKLSTRPVYRQRQQISSALLWRCCPGHGGHNCEDSVSGAQLDSGSSALIGGSDTVRTEPLAPGTRDGLQRGDPDREQSDHQVPYGAGYHDDRQGPTPPAPEPDRRHDPGAGPDPQRHQAHRPHQRPHAPQQHQLHQLHQLHRQQEHRPPVDEVDAEPLLYPEAPAPLPVPHMMALVMSQLQPVLQGFNRSLEQLGRQVGDLARDVARLKGSGPEEVEEEEMQSGAAEQRLDAKLDEVFQHVEEVRRQMESQRTDMENRLHSQHAMLHYNLTSFKTDVDVKLKRHQKMLQVSLQAMNATLTELKLDQDQPAEDQLEDHPPPPTRPPLQPPYTSALWEAIERLDNVVVNNSVKVGGLTEDLEISLGEVQQLRRDVKELETHINGTARTSQILFMETGLEVEAAREAVLARVGELARNLSRQGGLLQEMDVDVDYLYEAFYKHNSSAGCGCSGLKDAIALLGRGVANVTELANDNRLALEEGDAELAQRWGAAGDWEPAVEALQYGLQQVRESLASEHNRTRSLDQSLALLSSWAQADLSGLKLADATLVKEMQRLSGSFKSLLTDVIRHSDVLGLLLGEEVLEFLQWTVQDQEATSIPALKKQLSLLQEQQRRNSLDITSLQSNKPGGREELPSADQPSSSSSSSSSSHPLSDDWLPGSMRRNSGGVPARERQLLLRPEHAGDGSDLWNLEKTVEQLKLKVLLLEEKSFNASSQREAQARLQSEVMWLKRGLEEHLRVFKNVFSNADALVGSDATLELDKLWQLVKNRDGKKEKKSGGGRGGANRRSRRDTSGAAEVPLSQSGDPLLLVGGSPVRVASSVLVFRASLNRGQCYSDGGAFAAPLDGIYLFVLTLDLYPGRAHVVLRRGSGAPPRVLQRREASAVGGAVTNVGLLRLRRGEEVKLELRGAARTAVRTASEDHVLMVLLLHRGGDSGS
ncbi:mmrn2 [Pungitius sinensis]